MAALCDSCRKLKIKLLPDSVDRPEHGTYSGFHHSTTGELLINSQGCPFCALIKESFLRVGHFHIPEALVEEKLRKVASTPVLLRAGRTVGDGESVLGGAEGGAGAGLNSIEILVAHGKDFMRGRINLYAPKG
jgi:hypothetical protein